MKASICFTVCILATLVLPVSTQQSSAADPGWPRVLKKDGIQLTVHQPQVDFWHGYTNLHFRSAIAIKGVLPDERFGVVEVDSLTITDHGARVVAIVPLKRDIRFGNVTPEELTRLRQAAEQLSPMGQVTTLSLDRVVAYLDPAQQPVVPAVPVSLEPPRIFSSTTTAIMVMFMGEPRLVPVATNRTDLKFALNTNWDVLQDTASGQYFLLHGEGWLTTTELRAGKWMPATKLPPAMFTLPADPNWDEVRRHLPGKPAPTAPAVFVTTEPAELLLTAGPPNYATVPGTKLLRVTNTESVLFLHTGDGQLYYLVAGRWFRGGGLNGPWSAATANLPADFARIPDNDPAAFVKASVPGTREAQDAVLLASIPTTTTVDVTNPVNVNVTYSGAPQFVTITNTPVQYAVNSPQQVFLVAGRYYCCDQGVWLESGTANGPWTFCTQVPAAIYSIPPTNPNYNVTYVIVQNTTVTNVTYSQTSGYSGEYQSENGTLMFGMGLLIGAAIANNNDNYYYYPPYPCHYSYGYGATYHYGYGGYYNRGAAAYGPYGGAGYNASYDPRSGTYSRSSYAYGPYGSGSRSATYNPYTGNRSYDAEYSNAHGSASRSASYDHSSGQYSASSSRSSAYGSASRNANYNAQTGARSGSQQVSTDNGSVSRGAAYDPSTGQGAAGKSWDTANSQGAVGKTTSGDVYASNGDTVYKKDSDGSWSQNSGSGWESTDSPQQQRQSQASSNQQQAQSQTQAQAQSSASSRQSQGQASASSAQQQRSTSASTASSNWSEQHQSLEGQSQARQSGNQQAQRSSQFQSSGSTWGGRSSGAAGGGDRSRGGRR